MIVGGWHNGKANNTTGGGYAIRIRPEDRDNYFRKRWSSVAVELDTGEVVDARLSPSFWRKCRQLRGRELGKWMLDHGLAPWPKGKPPKFKLEPIGDRRFRLSRL